MTVRYGYNRQVSPPAPFVYIAALAPDQTTRAERIPALIDTGADLSEPSREGWWQS